MKYNDVNTLTIEWFKKNRNDKLKRFTFKTKNGPVALSFSDIADELEKPESEIKDAILNNANELNDLVQTGIEIRKRDEELGQAF